VVEDNGFEPMTFPHAFGTLYPTEPAEEMSHSMYFRLFLRFISSSLLSAKERFSSIWEYLTVHSGEPDLVEGVSPAL
jgi:hypothetical protein